MERNVANKKATFFVKVEHYQRGTWQGRVIWAEGNRAVRFRSALELIELMHEAMATGEVVGLDRDWHAS
jgi:hypothetical protein